MYILHTGYLRYHWGEQYGDRGVVRRLAAWRLLLLEPRRASYMYIYIYIYIHV